MPTQIWLLVKISMTQTTYWLTKNYPYHVTLPSQLLDIHFHSKLMLNSSQEKFRAKLKKKHHFFFQKYPPDCNKCYQQNYVIWPPVFIRETRKYSSLAEVHMEERGRWVDVEWTTSNITTSNSCEFNGEWEGVMIS